MATHPFFNTVFSFSICDRVCFVAQSHSDKEVTPPLHAASTYISMSVFTPSILGIPLQSAPPFEGPAHLPPRPAVPAQSCGLLIFLSATAISKWPFGPQHGDDPSVERAVMDARAEINTRSSILLPSARAKYKCRFMQGMHPISGHFVYFCLPVCKKYSNYQ